MSVRGCPPWAAMGNHGSPAPAASSAGPSAGTHSYVFDGASIYGINTSTVPWGDFGLNDYPPGGDMGPWSVSCWFKTSLTTTWQELLYWKDATASDWSRVLIGNPASPSSYALLYQSTAYAFDGTTGIGLGAAGAAPWMGPAAAAVTVHDGAWHHVVVTCEGVKTTGQISMYYDSVLVATGTQKTTVMDPDRRFYLGRGIAYYLNGSIFQTGLWAGTELSSGQVATLYNSGSASLLSAYSPAPSIYYTFGDDADPASPDTTTRCYDGGAGGYTLTFATAATIVTDSP